MPQEFKYALEQALKARFMTRVFSACRNFYSIPRALPWATIEATPSALTRYKPPPNLFDARLELPKMRAGPVNLSAARAEPEIVIIDFCERLQSIDYGALIDWSQ